MEQDNSVYLVIGATGLIGSYIYKELSDRDLNVFGTYYHSSGTIIRSEYLTKLDANNEEAIRHICKKLRPDVIFICVAETNVDKCEQHPEFSYRMNVEIPAKICRVGDSLGAKIVFFSSDYVFSGDEKGLYKEHKLPRPKNVYGMHKFIAESVVKYLCNLPPLIIRLTGVYGMERIEKMNFGLRVLYNAKEHILSRVPKDSFYTPVYAGEVASYLVDMVLCGERGLFHFGLDRLYSRAEFAHLLLKHAGMSDSLVLDVLSEKLSQKAERPKIGGVSSNKAPRFHVGESIDQFIKEFNNANS